MTHHGFARAAMAPLSLNPTVSDLIRFPETSPLRQIFFHKHPRTPRVSKGFRGPGTGPLRPDKSAWEETPCMTHSSVGLILGLLLWKFPRTAACYLLTDQRWPRTIQPEGLRGRGWRNGWRADSQVGPHCSCQKELCGDSRRGQRRRSLCQPHERLQQRGRQARKEKQKRQQLLVLSPYFWILE